MKKCVILIIFLNSFCVFGQSVSYQVLKVKDMGFISIPSNMEIQTGVLSEIARQYLSAVGYYSYEVAGDRIVFQPKGLNVGQPSGTYARVIIRTFKGNIGEYPLLDSSPRLSNQELSDYGLALKREMQASGVRIINWYGVENVMLNGKYNGTKATYSRQMGNNPPALTTLYQINNNDRVHGITFSFREIDRAYWEPILKKVTESIFIEKR